MPGRWLLPIVGSLTIGLAFAVPSAQEQGTVVFGVTGGVAGAQAPRDRQPPAPPGTATLRGHIFAGDSGQPLRKAQVRIIAPPVPGSTVTNVEMRTSTTDANGRYEFTSLRAGRYNVSAQKGGYLNLSYGQQRPNDPGKQVDVADGQTVEKVDFALPRGGVITGRILDEYGEPVADAQVAAVRSVFQGGTRRLVNAGRSGSSNDIGEFRLAALPPGDYYVSVTARNLNFGGQDDGAGYPPTYFPGTADVGSAQKLTIAIGQTISDITLSLQPIRTARVGGVAVDSRGQPSRGFVMAMMQSGQPMPTGNSQIKPDGSFLLTGMTPGEYTLTVQGQGGPQGINPAEQEYASVNVTVNGGDITDVRLVGTKPSTLRGRIVFVSGDSSSLRPAAIRATASPLIAFNIGLLPPPAAVNADWTFEIKARPGTTRLGLAGLATPWTIKAIRQRGTDVSDSGVEVRANEDLGDIEIDVTDRSTQVSGLLTNGRGEAAKGSFVVLFSRDRDKWKPPSRYVRTYRTDQDGRFKGNGLPPGDYLAFASEAIDLNQSNDPEFLDRLYPRGTNFSLREGEIRTLDLKVSAIP